MSEYSVTFDCHNEPLLGIVHPAVGNTTTSNAKTGVLIVVGGPQYRVGSHRQFIQLARSLAQQGYSCLRFDYRGMGDSHGSKAEFDQIDNDIACAIDAFFNAEPELEQVVIWGLCDAASAALIYAHQDPRVQGLILLNPWLRSDQAMGKTMLKFYYLQRLLSKSFWKKLFSGKVKVSQSIGDVKGFAKDSIATKSADNAANYQDRMVEGFNNYNGKVAFILSGNDLTAKEFSEQAFTEKSWQKIKQNACQITQLEQADHTFSTQEWKQTVEKTSLEFLASLSKKETY